MDLNQTPEQFASRQVKGFLRNLADGMTMAGAVRGVVLDTLKWRRERFIAAKGRPPAVSDEMEQSLRSHIKDLERECDRLKLENTEHIARNHEHLHTIAGLREAPKRITDEMNALIQTIAQQRDSAEMRAKAAQNLNGELAREKFELTKERDQLKADYTKLSALHQDVCVERDSAKVRCEELEAACDQREQALDIAEKRAKRYRERLAVYVKALGYMNTQLKTLEPVEGE